MVLIDVTKLCFRRAATCSDTKGHLGAPALAPATSFSTDLCVTAAGCWRRWSLAKPLPAGDHDGGWKCNGPALKSSTCVSFVRCSLCVNAEGFASRAPSSGRPWQLHPFRFIPTLLWNSVKFSKLEHNVNYLFIICHQKIKNKKSNLELVCYFSRFPLGLWSWLHTEEEAFPRYLPSFIMEFLCGES